MPPVADVDFRSNPPGADSFPPEAELVCKFLLKRSRGQTPKFYCVLPGGEVIKVKYGRRNPEPFAEVAATRLLSALGFGADRMFRVARVRCFGCPPYPQSHFSWLDSFFSDPSRYVDIAPATVERPFPGKKIASPGADGWAFYELGHIDAARRGARRAEIDALRLIAVFLADWDNKSANQRLVCLPGGEDPEGGCRGRERIIGPCAVANFIGGARNSVSRRQENVSHKLLRAKRVFPLAFVPRNAFARSPP